MPDPMVSCIAWLLRCREHLSRRELNIIFFQCDLLKLILLVILIIPIVKLISLLIVLLLELLLARRVGIVILHLHPLLLLERLILLVDDVHLLSKELAQL